MQGHPCANIDDRKIEGHKIPCANIDDRKIIPCPAARPRHLQYGSAPPPGPSAQES